MVYNTLRCLIKGSLKIMPKTKANRAIELLRLVQQVLESGNEDDVAKQLPNDKAKDNRGKNQPVGDYPNSPLRFKGWIH
ncbi:hypothetical protein LCGC14_1687350 [marine sediment metagenome]|uniref:Uncharacterized protein n=1 Tax=marine sediment metagenome TaxID=412755 RepID=A0A0F9KLW7_9ZZZZ